MTEILLPVSATDDVVEVAGAEVALAPPLPHTIGVMAGRDEPVLVNEREKCSQNIAVCLSHLNYNKS